MGSLNSSSVKSVHIEFEGRKYICKIEIKDEELININIYLDNKLKYKGNICLQKIKIKIKAFLYYNISEIFEEINKLNNNNFIIIKENNKYKLKIKFIILRRENYLYINLNENIIKEKDNIILEQKLNNKNDNLNNNNNLNDYNISLKNPTIL